MSRLTFAALAIFGSFVLLLVSFKVVYAISWPPEVRPEQGHAGWKTPVPDSYDGHILGESYTEVTFWNVGSVSTDPDHAKVFWTNDCAKSTVPGCSGGGTIVGTFSGGPNGIIKISGYEYKLHDGKYFEAESGGNTFKFNVDNPEIFSKYRWSMDESVPVPKIDGNYEVENPGNARFNDLYGQVEVNFPQADGTYDEEDWNFAKIDMEMPPGTRIKVSEKSGMILTFPDTQTSIIVGANSEIKLVSPDPQKSIISLPWGKLKANVQKMMKDGSIEIEMSQAVAGIKGTQFILNDTKTESTIKVTEGVVKFTSKSTGKSVDVGKGEAVTASASGLSEKTTFDPAAEEKQWQEMVDSFKKTAGSPFNNQYVLYALGGIVILAVFGLLGFKLLKSKKKK